MALKLITNYSKRLGLPGYSSHQFSVSLESEITSTDDVAQECTRLYETLQRSVDEEIQQTGFVPQPGYGEANSRQVDERGSGSNGRHRLNGNDDPARESWKCSDKQRELILKLVTEHQLDRQEIDETARGMFDVGVRDLNKLQASGLIDRLLEDHGGNRRKASRPRTSSAPRRPFVNGGAR